MVVTERWLFYRVVFKKASTVLRNYNHKQTRTHTFTVLRRKLNHKISLNEDQYISSASPVIHKLINPWIR